MNALVKYTRSCFQDLKTMACQVLREIQVCDCKLDLVKANMADITHLYDVIVNISKTAASNSVLPKTGFKHLDQLQKEADECSKFNRTFMCKPGNLFCKALCLFSLNDRYHQQFKSDLKSKIHDCLFKTISRQFQSVAFPVVLPELGYSLSDGPLILLSFIEKWLEEKNHKKIMRRVSLIIPHDQIEAIASMYT